MTTPMFPALFPILARVIATPGAHGRFANTLSLLEYIGARKIFKSQRAETFTAELLSHAAEEARHALMLKKLALKIDPALESYAPDHLLEGEAARAYIQALDREAARALGDDASMNYLYTTLLIEERARAFYPAYAELLAPLGQAQVIHAIVREEKNHLDQVTAHVVRRHGEGYLAALRAFEADAFARWLAAVDAGLDGLERIAH